MMRILFALPNKNKNPTICATNNETTDYFGEIELHIRIKYSFIKTKYNTTSYYIIACCCCPRRMVEMWPHFSAETRTHNSQSV